jgi:hypothetical protein
VSSLHQDVATLSQEVQLVHCHVVTEINIMYFFC